MPSTSSGPGWLPPGGRQGAIDRETLWYDYAVGVESPDLPPWLLRGDSGDPAQPAPVAVADLLATPGAPKPWPRGLWSSARLTSFPQQPSPLEPTNGDAVLRLAAHAVAPVRRDPDDAYNDHRAYASPRCAFPVHLSVVIHGEWHALDPDRRLVIPTGVRADPAHARGAMALSGRWDRIPSAYGWFRGSLVAIETGILLRHLAALSRLHATPVTLEPPRPGWEDQAPARLWRDPSGWSPPYVLTAGGLTAKRKDHITPWDLAVGAVHDDDAATDLARIYRSHTLNTAAGPLPTGVAETSTGGDSWSQVLWRRSAGRMPRGLYGFRVAETAVTLADAQAVARWAGSVAPPTVASATDGLRTYAVVRNVEGLTPGVHEIINDRFVHRSTAPQNALDRFASAYLYGSDPSSGNDIARAPLVLVVTSQPRDTVTQFGIGAWTATQVATGWLTHGVSLGAAARHLVARPVRALDERDVADALALHDDEMVGLAIVISHHAPHGGLQIDLRS